ncbi:hypothetical protein [Kitasatospora sp. NPDC094015]|uniref:hypothetical protein n=1 Tax=Kitasatospora sp. NPDC094015 TaxID=3155205 RepID=UPI00332FB46D
MKKRSMLAVASLAVGVVASLTAPSAHAAPAGDRGLTPDAVTAPDVPVDLLGTVSGGSPDLDGLNALPGQLPA